MRKPKICIISEYAFNYLIKNKEGSGGSELQLVLLAKELVKKDYEVHMIVFADSENNFLKVEGIKVHNPYDNKHNGINHFYPNNLYKFFSLLRKINPDILIQSSSTPITGLIGIFTKIKGKIFIFRSSSNSNVSTTLSIEKLNDLQRLPYIFGVKNTDVVVTQTYYQKALLKNHLPKKKTEIIQNIMPVKPNNCIGKSDTILWVGRIYELKRPELYLELAENLPEYKFKMIGSPIKSKIDYYNKIINATKKIDNLEFLGSIPHENINKYYSEASVFVSTSNFEGFPNTFLEAWANETPIISLEFDPDNLIINKKLGFLANNFEDLIKNIKILMESRELRHKMGKNCKHYVKKNHSSAHVLNNYERLFKNLYSSK